MSECLHQNTQRVQRARWLKRGLAYHSANVTERLEPDVAGAVLAVCWVADGSVVAGGRCVDVLGA